MPHVLPAALGAVETTVLRQAGAYAGFAAGGKEVVPTLIDSVQDRNGHVLWHAPRPRAARACDDPAQPPELTDNRKQVADPGQRLSARHDDAGRRAARHRRRGGRRAQPRHRRQDRHQPGFHRTPGSPASRPIWSPSSGSASTTPASLGNNETGGAVAAPIWHDFMAVALKDRPKLKFVAPPDVTMASWDSGIRPGHRRVQARQEPGASGGRLGRRDRRRWRGRRAALDTPGGRSTRPRRSLDSGMPAACIDARNRRNHHVRRIRCPARADQAVASRC